MLKTGLTLSDLLAFNLLGQLYGYLISCLDTLPVDLQERAPDFKEKDGMAMKGQSCPQPGKRARRQLAIPRHDRLEVGS